VGIAGVLQRRSVRERKNETSCNDQHQELHIEIGTGEVES
jgi:hypothetical protein